MFKDFCQTNIFKKDKKNGQFSFFDNLQLPHNVISNSEKLTHPSAQIRRGQDRFSRLRLHLTPITAGEVLAISC